MMQSISLDMDDIHGAEDGYLSNEEFPPLADELPPLSPTRRNNTDPFGDGDNLLANGGDLMGSDGDKENQGDKRPRRLVNRKPQPKLDATRLCSDRGLPTLSKHFEQVKFKGKGHEVSDLNRLMSTMEHWAHRLFPKMPFDEVIERIEKLGRKKPVQTCIRKIRLDMPLLDEEFVEQNDDPEGNVMDGSGGDEDEIEAFSQNAGPLSQTSRTPANADTAVSLSEEQKERMEQNKRLAMERRKSKGPTFPPSSQRAVTADEIQDMERNHSDEEDMEGELWNDIAMFEVSQRNIWKQAPNKVTGDKKMAADSGQASAEGEASKTSEIVDLTKTALDTNSRTVREDREGDLRKEAIVIEADSSDEETLEEKKKDVVTVTIEDDVEDGDKSEDDVEEVEGNTSSELVLKWDSADESMTVQEPSEKPSETEMDDGLESGSTSIATEVKEVAESDRKVSSTGVEDGTRDSPDGTSGGKIGGDVTGEILPELKMDEVESENVNTNVGSIETETTDEMENVIAIEHDTVEEMETD